MTQLLPGANAAVPLGDLNVLIRHDTISEAEIDVSAFLVTASGKVRSDEDMCFYGQPSVAGGSVTHSTTGKGETQFAISPGRIPAGVEKVVFTATIHENKAAFGRLNDIKLAVGGILGIIPCAGMTETALILGEIYNRNGAWKLRVVGQGFNGGLPALATYLGVEIAEVAPSPVPASSPASSTLSSVTEAQSKKTSANPVNLSKVSLSKKNSTVSLKKEGSGFGKVRVNLNWNQKTQKKSGFFGRGTTNLDLDLGAFVETSDGKRQVVQALGGGFGDFTRAPYVRLLGDDRTGAVTDGEWLEINGDKWNEIKRILVYAFIYEGAPNWQETDGIVRVLAPGQPEIEVRMNEYGDTRGTCAVVALENRGGQLHVSREVTFHKNQEPMDKHYGWGFRWSVGTK